MATPKTPQEKLLNPHATKSSRTTKDGRRLTYILNVIQQPERARACGSGAKSSADRRPVDPPPVVELAIIEGEGAHATDVTFAYNANFFLFATLEMSRPIIHGRVQPPPQQVPVLTGMPVSGMAYLDRPTEAGYFIFPDLSVRHEGQYKLSFNLYEQTKHENDTDAEPSNEQKLAGMTSPDSSFDWRLEVKSSEFHVYSAKKFPGLAESTTLSRTIAEQGCRVRIRRDVRMRRREDKPPQMFEEEDYARVAHTSSDYDAFRERSRSRSHSAAGSEDGGEFGHGPPPPGGHLGFLNQSTQQQFHHPQMPQPAYQHRPFDQTPPSYARPTQSIPSPYGADRNAYPPHSAHPSIPPREREHDADLHRRASLPVFHNPNGQSVEYKYQAPMESNFNQNAGGYSNAAPVTLPPISSMSGMKYESQASTSAPLAAASRLAPSLQSPTYGRTQDSLYGQYPTPMAPEAKGNGKRTYDSVFAISGARQNEPLHNGMRPDPSVEQDSEDSYATSTMEEYKMTYRRAGGPLVSRALPVGE